MSSTSQEVDHLNNWLKNLKQDYRLTPPQFVAIEKAILLAISTFESNNDYSSHIAASPTHEPMEIDV